MTVEERKETNLRGRWYHSEERKVLDKYTGKPIEEIPEEYREKIKALREYGLGGKEKQVCEEIIEWLETHDCEMPRSSIYKNRRQLKKTEMSSEEYEERMLYVRWLRSEERKILNQYAERPIEEVPEEYREKIAKLRSLGQMGTKKDDKIKSRMKKSVGKKVGDNQDTRQELEATKQVEEQVDLLD